MIEFPKKISILGMGYVGLPLAIEFSKNMMKGQIKQSGGKEKLSSEISKEFDDKQIKCAFKYF